MAPTTAPTVELPVQLTSFIGREPEIAAVRAALRVARLLTLTGAGGSGKTRLAIEVAARVAGEYADGIAWIELAPLSDADLLAQHVAAGLGIRDEAGRPAVDVLLQALRDRSLLLILDNCEHLADECARFADTLLRGCASLAILATSREALGVAGERAWLVPPLSLPREDDDIDAGRLLEFEAVRLFVTRAQDVAPSFMPTEQNAAAIVRICRRLDGLPLAIELSAARVTVLTAEQIAQRLHNAFALLTSGSRTALPRHRTLRAAIDWSYQLLSESERILLRRLSVFAGGFTLEAAEAVCPDERLEAGEVLDVLARLVERSLVVMGEQDGSARYHILETVRHYALERLAEHGEEHVMRDRHAKFFLAFAAAAEPHLFLGGNDPAWLARLEAEVGNLRAAAERFETDPDGAESALRLAIAIRWRWYNRGHFAEMRNWIERALERGGDVPPATRAQALMAIAYAAYTEGRFVASTTAAETAVELLRSLNDPELLSFALANLGVAKSTMGQDDSGEAHTEEAIALARTLSPAALIAPLGWAGYPAYLRGDYSRAQRLLDEGFAIAVRLRFRFAAGQIASGRTQVALAQGDETAAILRVRESLELAQETRDPSTMLLALEALAVIEMARQNVPDAERLFAIAESIRERTGFQHRPFANVNTLVGTVRQRLGETALSAAVAQERAVSLEQAVDFALGLVERVSTDVAWSRGRALSGTPTLAAPDLDPVPSPSAVTITDVSMAGLRVLALGPLEIYREGELLSPELWRYAKPKELLLYLLAHPEGRTREQIGLAFWPESSAAQVKNSFHVTLHHLRKALGRADWIVFEDDRYRISPDIAVEFDALTFEQQVTAALRDARAGHGSADALRAALALYRGDFLEDETAGDWHLELRDRLGRLRVEGLCALGERLMEAGQYGEAAGVYQRVVLREDLHEEAHRRLMFCLAHNGERHRALRHYEQLVALLREELDAAPEEETVTLYESLRKHEPMSPTA